MELLLLLFICPSIFLLSRYYLSRFQYRVPRVITNTVFVAFFISVLLFTSTFYLAGHNLYYWGYRSHSWIFHSMTMLGILYFFLRPMMKTLSNWEYLPLMTVTILVAFSSIQAYVVFWDYKSDLVYKDKRYRVERYGWFMSNRNPLKIFLRQGFFEKELEFGSPFYLHTKEIDSVKISQAMNDTLIVTFYHHSDWKDMPNPVVTKAFKR